MFERKRPGGLMLIPNFLTGVLDTGYMEAFMDWRLIYRNHSDMMALAAALPRSAVADCQVFDDNDDAITCLLVGYALACHRRAAKRTRRTAHRRK
jgi:extracellular factor (EF) 3-hydroxypalmitic acid methyl ester biosynthesis protein